jgi:hypothetical protein
MQMEDGDVLHLVENPVQRNSSLGPDTAQRWLPRPERQTFTNVAAVDAEFVGLLELRASRLLALGRTIKANPAGIWS